VPCLATPQFARRTLAMRVDACGRVILNMPLSMPIDRMVEFVRRH